MQFLKAILLASALLCLGCNSNATLRCLPGVSCEKYDIIIVAGQSNATSRGEFKDKALEFNNDRIWQIGRYSIKGAIIPASEPLETVSHSLNGNGFALAFARRYRDSILAADRHVLIVPVAKGTTSVVGPKAYWGPTGEGLKEAVEFSRAAANFPDSHIVAILWHQGESDINVVNELYKKDLKSALETMRGNLDIPIVLGQLAPSLLEHSPSAIDTNMTITNFTNELSQVGIALSSGLETNGVYAKTPNDYTHFTAESQLELGQRYFCAFARIKFPELDIAKGPDCISYSIVN